MDIKVKNKELLAEIIQSQKDGELTVRCLEVINRMALHYSQIYKPHLQEEYRLFAMDRMVNMKYWKTLNSERTQNAFAYIAQIIRSSFAGYYRNKIHGRNRKL